MDRNVHLKPAVHGQKQLQQLWVGVPVITVCDMLAT